NDKKMRHHALSEEEKAAGWKLLFDGQTTAEWRGYNRQSLPESWQVREGALVLVPSSASPRCDLVTVDEFEDFNLTFEWKITAAGNSGVHYRVTEGQLQGQQVAF
ncbi:MAG TPA: DUF1080 domain-containing protein, partial [Gemmataceae bacterium]|nr:DUF1080 domain-containing protein [Gemmataceae bacterium]